MGWASDNAFDPHSICTPPWKVAGQECPFGAVFGDIGAFHAFDPLYLATWTWPDAHEHIAVDALAAFYSSVEASVTWIPLLVAVGLLCGYRVRTSPLLALLGYWVWMIPIKSQLKKMAAQPRPAHSCLFSCGMPSGHSTFALFAWTWVAIVVLTRQKPPSRGAARGAVLLASALLLPIPWSRVQLGDHSLAQIIAGSALGAALGASWWALLGTPMIRDLVAALVAATDRCSHRFALEDDYYGFWGGSSFPPPASEDKREQDTLRP